MLSWQIAQFRSAVEAPKGRKLKAASKRGDNLRGSRDTEGKTSDVSINESIAASENGSGADAGFECARKPQSDVVAAVLPDVFAVDFDHNGALD